MPEPLNLDEMSEAERKRRLSHRERVKKSAAAREAAWRRLAELHPEEYVALHEEEKAARGILTRHPDYRDAEVAKLREIARRYPHLFTQASRTAKRNAAAAAAAFAAEEIEPEEISEPEPEPQVEHRHLEIVDDPDPLTGR